MNLSTSPYSQHSRKRPAPSSSPGDDDLMEGEDAPAVDHRHQHGGGSSDMELNAFSGGLVMKDGGGGGRGRTACGSGTPPMSIFCRMPRYCLDEMSGSDDSHSGRGRSYFSTVTAASESVATPSGENSSGQRQRTIGATPAPPRTTLGGGGGNANTMGQANIVGISMATTASTATATATTTTDRSVSAAPPPPLSSPSLSSASPASASNKQKKEHAIGLTDGESLLADDLKRLSLVERNEAYDDVHGVAKIHNEPEDPNFVKQKLKQLNEKLNNIRDKKAFEKAAFLFPRYLKDDNLRLSFLRPYNFDVTSAARQMVDYFQCKLELFGANKLGKELTLDDLSPDDLEAYNSGIVQFFTRDVRDRSGRTLFFYMFNLHRNNPGIHELRAIFYTISSGWRNLTVADQKNGSVAVVYFIGATHRQDLDYLLKAVGVAKSLSPKVAACHVCYDSAHLRPAVSLMMVSFTRAARVRCRSHYGSHLECCYALRSYGIDESVFPLDENNELDQEKFRRLVDKQRQFENEQQLAIMEDTAYPTIRGTVPSTPIMPSSITAPLQDTVVPTDADVLLGRGRPFQVHPGNMHLANLIDKHREEHGLATKTEKTKIAWRLVKLIQQEGGGRFLKLSDDGLCWEGVSDDAARSKVAHGFRSHGARSNKTARAQHMP